MGDIIRFDAFSEAELLPEEMTRDQLLALLEQLRAEIARLDEAEPLDMDSEEYEAWGEEHEDLEDQVDEILDLLDEMD